MSTNKEKQPDQAPERALQSINRALDRSAHELQLLANFYHQHGFTERAQELYRTLLRIRKERNNRQDS